LNLQYRNQLCFTENNRAWHFFISSKNSNGIVFYNCYLTECNPNNSVVIKANYQDHTFHIKSVVICSHRNKIRKTQSWAGHKGYGIRSCLSKPQDQENPQDPGNPWGKEVGQRGVKVRATRYQAGLSKFSKHFARRCAFVALAYVITSWNNGPNNSAKKQPAKATHMYAKI